MKTESLMNNLNMKKIKQIVPAINPLAQIVGSEKILMDRTIMNGKTVTEEQKLNIKPLFS